MNLRLILLALIVISSCAPYAKGPVFTIEETNEIFHPYIEFMEIKPGMTVADVGAGSGIFTIVMATQFDSCKVLIQDIDQETLQQNNVDKMISHYSGKLGYDLGARNQFEIIYGTPTKSNLPDQSVDVIYTNATIHVFDAPNEMLQNLRKTLKPTGKIFIRDAFKGDNGKGDFCSDSKCAKPLYTIDEFLEMMNENGYKLLKQSPEMDGYPVFGFGLMN